MILRNRLNAPIRLGLVFLAIGNLMHLFLHPSARFGQDAIDGVTGLMLGISIGLMLLGLTRGRRGHDRN